MLFIEPSILSFDSLRKINDYTDKSKELNDFQLFLGDLDSLLDNLNQNQYKIFVSREFWEQILSCIPVSVYGADPRYAIARELYMIRLPKFIQRIHSFGDHNLQGTILPHCISNSNLLELETYILWIDLLIANKSSKYPYSVLKSSLVSICRSATIDISVNEELLTYKTYNLFEELMACPNILRFKLKHLIGSEVETDEVPCHGTGTHDSMWGVKITDVNDIPAFERALILKLIETKIVKSITFLNFDKRSSAVDDPYIKIVEIFENENGDVLHCEIFGNGTKQNCQKLSILLKKGFGNILLKACDRVLNRNFLNSILH